MNKQCTADGRFCTCGCFSGYSRSRMHGLLVLSCSFSSTCTCSGHKLSSSCLLSLCFIVLPAVFLFTNLCTHFSVYRSTWWGSQSEAAEPPCVAPLLFNLELRAHIAASAGSPVNDRLLTFVWADVIRFQFILCKSRVVIQMKRFRQTRPNADRIIEPARQTGRNLHVQRENNEFFFSLKKCYKKC